jgi:hypothetical protein
LSFHFGNTHFWATGECVGIGGESAVLSTDRVLLLKDRRSREVSVENVGIKIRPIRPSHGAEFPIDTNLRKVGGVSQWLEDSPETELRREIHYTLDAILKAKSEAIIAKWRRGNDIL